MKFAPQPAGAVRAREELLQAFLDRYYPAPAPVAWWLAGGASALNMLFLIGFLITLITFAGS